MLIAVETDAALPAEEHINRRLGEPPAADTPFTVIVECARTEVWLEHRGLRLLHLKNERVLAST
jgi:hypothetical protein